MSLPNVSSSRPSCPALPLETVSGAQKLLGAGAFAVCVSLLRTPALAAAACCIPLVLTFAARLPLGLLLRRLAPVNFFFLFLWIVLPLDLSSGSPEFSRRGLEQAALITLKGNAAAAMLLVVVHTSRVAELCRGLIRLHLPEKIVALLLLTYANLALMHREYGRLQAAARLRGYAPGCSINSCRTTGYLMAMLLVRSWQRSQRVGQAMRLRGFGGRFPLLDASSAPMPTSGIPFAAGLSVLGLTLLAADCFLSLS